jgi:branched-chain amino acid transport system substrate-binding protein
MSPGRLAAAAVAAVLALASCAPRAPILVGFIGSLSGANSDMGQEARNGIMLAAEARNARGGVRGRRLELVLADDRSGAELGALAARDLVARRVAVAIGTFSSVIADAVVPVFDEAGIVLISPNVSAMRFVGKDDHYFRLNSSTKENAGQYARFLSVRRGAPAAVLLWDRDNATFSRSWLEEFSSVYGASGARVLGSFPFGHGPGEDYAGIAAKAAALRPGAIVLVANAIDSARFAQLFRRSGSEAVLAAAEWAGTAQLLGLGGRAAEGLIMLQEYDPFDEGAAFAAFRAAYRDRFRSEPSFTSVLTWDACQAAFAALEGRRKGEDLRSALLRLGPYQGLQQKVAFDAFGDSRREAVFSVIRDGRYQKAE